MNDFIGQTIRAITGEEFTITGYLTQGAQGAICEEASGRYLVKIYHKSREQKANKQLDKLKSLYNQPYPKSFIKPLYLISEPFIGYVMLRVKGHEPLNRLLIPPASGKFSTWFNESTGGLRRRYYLGYQIADTFHHLHATGQAYCDISGSNILVAKDFSKASICMIDIDNLYVPGTGIPDVLGTLRYMAPEIISKQMVPDIISDDHSLAVLLFELLRIGHPYIGNMVDNGTPDMELLAFQGNLPYIDDESQDCNHSSQVLPSNDIFTSKLEALFKRAFVSARQSRMNRPTALEFAIACLEASNRVIRCESCKAWFLYNKKENNRSYCSWCGAPSGPYLYLLFRERYRFIDHGGQNRPDQKKTAKAYILKQMHNCIQNMYIYQDSNCTEIEEYFSISYDTVHKYRLQNPAGKELYIKKYNSAVLNPVKANSHPVIEPEDKLYFMRPAESGSIEKIGLPEGSVTQYAVVKEDHVGSA